MWTCLACTYENQNGDLKECEICATARPENKEIKIPIPEIQKQVKTLAPVEESSLQEEEEEAEDWGEFEEQNPCGAKAEKEEEENAAPILKRRKTNQEEPAAWWEQLSLEELQSVLSFVTDLKRVRVRPMKEPVSSVHLRHAICRSFCPGAIPISSASWIEELHKVYVAKA